MRWMNRIVRVLDCGISELVVWWSVPVNQFFPGHGLVGGASSGGDRTWSVS